MGLVKNIANALIAATNIGINQITIQIERIRVVIPSAVWSALTVLSKLGHNA